MKLVSIDDRYIEKLRELFPSIMDNKRYHITHTRKYLGVLLVVNGLNYYAPLSSPKPRDYNSDGTIKKDNMFSLHMTKNEDGKQTLLGTIKLNNMIPVPMNYVNTFAIETEGDEKYRDVLNDEFMWINKNQEHILKSATHIYNFKINEGKNKNDKNEKQYNSIAPFKEIEAYLNNSAL